MPVPAFLLFGTSPRAAKELSEAFRATVATRADVRWRNVSGLSYMDVRMVCEQLKRQGFAPTIYVKEAALPRTITESHLQTLATYGMMLRGLKNVIVLKHGINEMVTHAAMMLEAEGQAPKPKETTEVDRLRTQQKQEDLLMKKRQNDQLLQAQQRELTKKSRDTEQKLSKPKTGAHQE